LLSAHALSLQISTMKHRKRNTRTAETPPLLLFFIKTSFEFL